MAGHPLLKLAQHRPYPVPQRAWMGFQSWQDLLFAHWPVPAAPLAALLPPDLQLDTYHGQAWISVVPFRMAAVHPRGLPPVPGLSWFPELNVRTYVRHAGLAGVFFLSLDAHSRVAVWLGRRLFHLPYHHASMRQQRVGAGFDYVSRRRADPSKSFAARYTPTGSSIAAPAGSLEHWLTERYYFGGATDQGRGITCEVHHPAWPLQTVEVHIENNTMVDLPGVHLPIKPALAQFAQRIDVLTWWPASVMRAQA